MKKWISLFVLMVMMATSSLAAEGTNETMITMTQGLLTEVYGYTQTEAEAFTIEITQEENAWAVRFYNHPGWVYTASFALTDLGFLKAASPFVSYKTADAPENSVRSILRAMKDNDWFLQWDTESRAALEEALQNDGNIFMRIELREGLKEDTYTASQALYDFFASCYGEELFWQPALAEWRDQVFEELNVEPISVITMVEPGVHTRQRTDTKLVCEFLDAVPQELEAAFSHPNLQGWQCLAGAYRVQTAYLDRLTLYGSGLAAFEKDGQRMLVMLYKLSANDAWQVAPVGEKALLKERVLYITFSNNNSFDVYYPISDVAEESFGFWLQSLRDASATVIQCELAHYTWENFETRQRVQITSKLSDSFGSWYQVLSVDQGDKQIDYYPALAPLAMEYIDAEAFPKTEAECEAAAEATETIPDGYGIASYVHLRGDTSSRAKDLGMLRSGTLVQVLDTVPGDPYDWYHVRLGDTEGYIASIYVTYPDAIVTSVLKSTLSVAKTKKQTALKQGTGWFAKTLETLPEGTLLRVLGETGNWLIVSIPQTSDDWLMRPDETVGYVKMNDVLQAGSPIQLEWMQP